MDVQPQTSMHQELSNLHRLDKFFTLEYPHNCEKPESYRPCHSLNPYRHRTLCTRGLLLLYIGQTTRDKCTVIPVILLWLCLQKAPSTRNFQTYTAWQSFLLWSPTQPGAARRFQGMPQPKWAGFTRGWHAAQKQELIPMSGGSVIPVMLLCLVAAYWQDAMLLCGKCWTSPKSQK